MLLSVRIVSHPPHSTPVGRNWEKPTVAWSCAATSAGRDTSYASGTGQRSTFGGAGPYGPAGGSAAHRCCARLVTPPNWRGGTSRGGLVCQYPSKPQPYRISLSVAVISNVRYSFIVMDWAVR